MSLSATSCCHLNASGGFIPQGMSAAQNSCSTSGRVICPEVNISVFPSGFQPEVCTLYPHLFGPLSSGLLAPLLILVKGHLPLFSGDIPSFSPSSLLFQQPEHCPPNPSVICLQIQRLSSCLGQLMPSVYNLIQ